MIKAEWTNKDSLDLQPTCNQLATMEGDLISRADAIEAVVAWTVEDRPHEEMPTDLVDRIKALPSADAVQGEWIDRSNGGRIKYPWWESCECNQCGEYGSGAYNYCPSCGARMKGGAE